MSREQRTDPVFHWVLDIVFERYRNKKRKIK